MLLDPTRTHTENYCCSYMYKYVNYQATKYQLPLPLRLVHIELSLYIIE